MNRSRLYQIILVYSVCISLSMAYAKEEVVGVWGDETRSVVLSNDGHDYFLQYDSSKSGPYEYVSLVKFHTRDDISTSFYVVEAGKTYVMGLDGDKLGPYHEVKDFLGGKIRCALKNDRVSDIIIDDGTNPRIIGTTKNKPIEAGISSDSKHAYLYSRDSLGQEWLTIDSYETPISFRKEVSARVLGFYGTPSRLWVISPVGTGYYLLIITPSQTGGTPTINALYGGGNGGVRVRQFMKSDDLALTVVGTLIAPPIERPLELVLPAWCYTQDRSSCAVRFKDQGDTEYGFNGQDLFTVSQSETYNPDKSQMSISSDGKTVITVSNLNDERGGYRTNLVRKNGKLLSKHPESKIAQIEMINGGSSCAYMVLGINHTREMWLDGTFIAKTDAGGIFTDATTLYEESTTKMIRTSYFGYYQVVHNETTTLYRFGESEPIAGPYPGCGTFYNYDGKKPEWPLVYRRDQPSSVSKKLETENQFYIGGKALESRRSIGNPVFSEDGTVLSYVWKQDYSMKQFVRTGTTDSGPYTILGNIMYVSGEHEPIYIFGNGSSVFFGSPRSKNVRLPGYFSKSNTISGVCFTEISPDGQTVQYTTKMSLYSSADSKKKTDYETAALVVNGKPYSGHYYRDLRMTLYVDQKTGKVVRIMH